VSEVIKLPQSKHVGVNGKAYYYVQDDGEEHYRTEEFPFGPDCRLHMASEQLEKYGIAAPTKLDRTRFNKNKREEKLKAKEEEAEETLVWQKRNLTSASMQIIKFILAKAYKDNELTPAEMSIQHEFLSRGERHLLTPEGQHVYAKNQAMISTKERLAEIKDQEKTLDFIMQKAQKGGKLTPAEHLIHQQFLSRYEQNKLTPGEQYLHWRNQRNVPKKKRHIEKKEDEKTQPEPASITQKTPWKSCNSGILQQHKAVAGALSHMNILASRNVPRKW